VYGAAFEEGARQSDGFIDGVVEIPLGNGAFWRPTDGGGPSGEFMSLRQGLMFSKNTITAQVMQVVGPAHVAKLARSMGVRQSKLEEVPSLALGTSPVTLKEMVSAYGTLANDGRYIEPIIVTRVEDRNGKVLEEFQAKAPEAVMSTTVAQTLLDVMRGVIDQGTGAAIRSRYGMRADVAGKTGTTQGNTDGWFVMMHPQLVAGAWVGFNDNRVTMGDSWGQGARSALPIVGEFFQQAIKAKVVDAEMRFPAPQGGGVTDVEQQRIEALLNGAEPPQEGQPGEVPAGVGMAGASPAVEGGAPRWQPAPVIKYVTIQVPAESTPPAMQGGDSGGTPGVVLQPPTPVPVEKLQVFPGVVVGAPIAPR
jgi:penicillin-binding protein 1A